MQDVNTLSEVEIDLNDFGGLDGNSILTPAPIFSRAVVDTSALNNFNPKTDSVIEEKTKTEVAAPIGNEEKEKETEQKFEIPVDLNDQLLDLENVPDEDPSIGRAKTSKDALVEYVKEKIDLKEFVPFDDYDDKVPVDEYLAGLSKKDLHALIDENVKIKENKVKEEIPQQFFDSLPEELQLAADYYINKNGRDLKGLFQALGRVEEVRSLDPENENDQEAIVVQYLRNANPDWETSEIQEQVEEWKDLGQIDKKAKMLKPKLDRMQEQTVQFQIEEQNRINEQRRLAAEKYRQNVYEVLKPAEIGGLKIDSKKQNALYAGLTEANYKSISGGNTNLLGHLLEKFQYQEPNYSKIAKVLWLLEDEEGYENALIQKGKNANTESTVKKLKTEQGNRASTSSGIEESSSSKTRLTITKPGKDIFKR